MTNCKIKTIDGIDQEEIIEVSDEVRLSNGTVTDPSLTFIDDDDTGIYRVGADEMAITTGGVQRLSVSSTETNINTSLITANAEYVNTGQSSILCTVSTDIQLANGAGVNLQNGNFTETYKQGEIDSNIGDAGANMTITVGKSGRYLILYGTDLQDNGNVGVSGSFYTYFALNGGGNTNIFLRNYIVDSGTLEYSNTVSWIMDLSASDYLTFRAYQANSGGVQYKIDANVKSHITMIKIC
jgi:hypothetical protein